MTIPIVEVSAIGQETMPFQEFWAIQWITLPHEVHITKDRRKLKQKYKSNSKKKNDNYKNINNHLEVNYRSLVSQRLVWW